MDAPEVVMHRIKHGDKAAEQELINHFCRPLYFIIWPDNHSDVAHKIS